MREAVLEQGVPQTAGWFVVNAREARWLHDDMRSYCDFGGQGEAHFDELGIKLYELRPGRPMALYHGGEGQEDFLVLRGECRLIVEGQERSMVPWDLFHCPRGTRHVILGAGGGPSLVLALGARGKGRPYYPVEIAALRYGAGVEQAESPDEAYARFGELRAGPAPDDL